MERRKHERFNDEMPAIIVGGPHGTSMRGARVRDLSEGGACIELNGPLPVGAETYVGFFLKDDSRPLIAVARVVWTRPDGGIHLMGVQFSVESASQRAAIAKLRGYLETRRLELVVSTS